MVISSVCLWSFTAVQMAILRARFTFQRTECIAKAVSTEMPLKACFAILIAYHIGARKRGLIGVMSDYDPQALKPKRSDGSKVMSSPKVTVTSEGLLAFLSSYHLLPGDSRCQASTMLISSVCLWSFTGVQIATLRRHLPSVGMDHSPFTFVSLLIGQQNRFTAKTVLTETPLKASFVILIAYRLGATSCTKRRFQP
ncbi:hypothetical protein C8J56DRAFT_1065166 [Mycena floridula]|nr:hypothetical protein C8J56DRAFT_1065166 [Mycena floridula]